jgi:hypothetical protein
MEKFGFSSNGVNNCLDLTLAPVLPGLNLDFSIASQTQVIDIFLHLLLLPLASEYHIPAPDQGMLLK